MSVRSVGRFTVIIVGAILAWLAVYGPSHFDWATMFVPWHHDDFESFEGFNGFSVAMVRPVSTNFEFFFGQFGETFYYLLIYALVFTALALTVVFTDILFFLNLNIIVSLIFSFVASAVFFAIPYAGESLQYLGLQTNLLSYIFGISAAIVLLGRNRPIWSLWPAVPLVLLAAFSKEDMAAFLVVVGLARLGRERAAGLGLLALIGNAICYVAVVCLPYALSVFQSLELSSAFLANRGMYDLSDPLGNMSRNLLLYLSESTGTLILFGLFLVAAVLPWVTGSVGAALRRYRGAAIVAVACVGTLLLPYLLLPRFFSWYTVTFLPLVATSVLALGLVACRAAFAERRVVLALSSGVLAGALAVGLFFVDAGKRDQVLAGYAVARKSVALQLQGVTQAVSQGLGACNAVLVTGVSTVWSPFRTIDTRYLQRRFHIQNGWIVVTDPNTPLEGFVRSQSPHDFVGPIRFVTRDQLEAVPKEVSYDCRLDFAPETLAMSFHTQEAPPGLTIVAFGPLPVKAGVPFNVQPNQQSALWMKATEVHRDMVMLWNGQPLVSFSAPDQKLVTALVPNDLIAAPGKIHLTLHDPVTKEDSPPVDLEISP